MTIKLVIKNAKLDDQQNQTQDASIINKSIRNQFSYANYLLWQTVLEAYLGPSQTSMKDLLFRK